MPSNERNTFTYAPGNAQQVANTNNIQFGPGCNGRNTATN